MAPGTVPQPAPTLAYSRFPITSANPGRVIQLPEPQPLDVTQHYPRASSVSFTDGLNAQTTYYYHVAAARPGSRHALLLPGQRRRERRRRRHGASFETAPGGRAKFRFSSYGDLATPSWDLNASGNIWHESCDNSYYAVSAIESPGDGNGPPLFHLLNGDLCYANLDVMNAPSVWRDFGVNVAALGQEPAVDARPRQPRDRVRHLRPRRPARHRAPAASPRRAPPATTGTARTATATTSAGSCCPTTA